MKTQQTEMPFSAAHPRIRKHCYNCKHASPAFFVIGQTHHHCEHPDIPDEDKGWGTLHEWHNACEKWEAKIKV